MERTFNQVRINETDISYNYKFGLDLKPQSQTHSAILDNILQIVTASSDMSKNRLSSWNDIRNSLNVYAPPETVKRLREHEIGVVPEVKKSDKIVIPTLFTSLDVLMTNMMPILSQKPVFRYSPVDSDDYLGASFMEANINHQYYASKMMLDLYLMVRDSFAYGVGGAHVDWIVKTVKARPAEGTVRKMLQMMGKRNLTVNNVIYEGSKVNSISPEMLLLDPNVSCDNVQDGVFSGHIEHTNVTSLLDLENSDRRVFNVKYLLLQNNKIQQSNVTAEQSKPVEVIWLCVKVIPRAFGLGRSLAPETWLFGLANRSVIIYAEPSVYAHGMFPYAVAAPTTDGSTYPKSLLEIVYPLHKAQNFLWNSKMASLKRAINMMLLVDPFVVNTDDLQPDNETGVVRLSDNAWVAGRIRDAIMPVPYNEPTAGNLVDMAHIKAMIDQVTGAGEPATGSIAAKRERVAAAEITNSMDVSGQRFGKHAMLISVQALRDIGLMMAYNTRQFMSRDIFVKLSGKTQQDLQRRYGMSYDSVSIKAADIDLATDVEVNTPDTGFAADDVAGLTEMLKTSMQSPVFSQRIDLPGLLLDIMKKLGVKNADEFDLGSVQSEDLQNQVDKGNLVPVGGPNV